MSNSVATAQARLTINGKEVVNSFDAIKNRIKQTRKEMNGLEQGTAAYARKEKDLIKLETRLSGITQRQRDIRKSAKMVVNQNGQLVKSYAQLTPYGGMLTQFGQQYDVIKKGINTNVAALGRLKVALVSTGIGAIVVLFGSLITYLTSTQEGMDKITSVTRPLKALFQTLIGVVQNLGKAGFDYLANAIKNPKDALNDLWQFIKDQVIHRFEALGIVAQGVAQIFKGEFKEGARAVADGALQMATGVEDVIDKVKGATSEVGGFVSESLKAGQELDRLTKQIERMEIDMITRRAELNVQYERSRELAMDASLTDAERIKAAKEAKDAQNELLNMEQRFMDLKIQRMQLEHSLNDTSRADEKELAQLIAARTEFEANASKKRLTVNSTLNRLLKNQNKAHREEELELERAHREFKEIELAQVRTMELEAIVNHEKLKNDVVKNSLQEEINKRKEAARKNYELEQQQAEQQRELQSRKWEARAQMAQGFADNFVNILNFMGASEEKMAGFQKGATLLQIALDTAAAISSLTANSEANPANAVTFGAAGVAQFVAGLVRITTNMAKAKQILSKSKEPNAPKFQSGGMVGGPSHAEGGIKLVNGITGQTMGEMEGGEGILTRAVANRPDLRALVNYANMQAGGARIYKDGGQTPAAVANSGSSGVSGSPSSGDIDKFARSVDKLEMIVAMFPKEVRGKWVYQDFKRMENELNEARGRGL